MTAKICPRLLIDIPRGVVRVNGKRIRSLVRDTRPWKALVALARAKDGCPGRDALLALFDGHDAKARVRDVFRRLGEALKKDGIDINWLIRRVGHEPWRLVARVKIRDCSPEIPGASSASNVSAIPRSREAKK